MKAATAMCEIVVVRTKSIDPSPAAQDDEGSIAAAKPPKLWWCEQHAGPSTTPRGRGFARDDGIFVRIEVRVKVSIADALLLRTIRRSGSRRWPCGVRGGDGGGAHGVEDCALYAKRRPDCADVVQSGGRRHRQRAPRPGG